MEQKLENLIKSKPKSKYQKQEIDSSDISSLDEDDIDNMTNQDIEKMATNNFVENDLIERITKYIKIDNKIKEKQKEVREYVQTMKKQKEDMEKFIIKYLEDVDQEFVKIDGEGKLIKATTTTKGAINAENIKTSIVGGFKKENINLDDKQFINLLETVLTMIDENRPKKTKTYIKRTKERVPKASTKSSKKSEIVDNQKDNKNTKATKRNEIDSDDELPKY